MRSYLCLFLVLLFVLCFTVSMQVSTDNSESKLLRSKRYGGFGYYGGSGGGCDTCGGGYFGGYAPSNFYGGGCDMCGGGYRSYYGYFG
uniref:Candidate secreted effector n=1 Tax=Meloidogyne incognita TaxID=6306 RepID=A0A914KTB0_MELIC